MNRVPRKKQAVTHEVPETGETAVCNVERGELLVLNDVGAAVWLLVDGTRTVDEIVEFVCANLDSEPTEVDRDVRAFLGKLQEHDLIGFEP
jgi:hypothetical protein